MLETWIFSGYRTLHGSVHPGLTYFIIVGCTVQQLSSVLPYVTELKGFIAYAVLGPGLEILFGISLLQPTINDVSNSKFQT